MMSLISLINFIEKNKVTTAERHITNIIINFHLDIVTKSVKDVAQKAHVVHSTVSRLIKKIGYDSWNAFITSILFEEKIKASNHTNALDDKINLEIENVKLFLRTKAQQHMQAIVTIFLNKDYNFVFYGKRLTGNVAQYITWNFTSKGLFATHTYFLDELYGILNQKSVLIAFCSEEINSDFLEAISHSRTRGAKVISILTGKDKKTEVISHLSLQIPTMGYFKNDIYWNIIQNEILRFVGLKLFEEWHQQSMVPKN